MNVIAIDGPGGSGKTTVSRGVAATLGLAHLDTGAFYRAVTLEVLRRNTSPDGFGSLARSMDLAYDEGVVRIDGKDVSNDIRTDAVDGFVSTVSADPTVRREMVRRQRQWVEDHDGAAVVEGRDIGTVVFPGASLKIFLVARAEVRAARRAKEMNNGSAEVVQEDLARRDSLDSSRAVSPLTPADDAVVLDTSDLTVDQVVGQIVRLERERT